MENGNYKFEHYINTTVPKWDQAVIDSRGNFSMTSVWGKYKTQLKYRSCETHLLLVLENNSIAAGIQIEVYSYRLIGKVGAACGIVCRKEKAPDTLNILLGEKKRLVAKHHISCIGINLEGENDKEFEHYFKAAGFHIKPPMFLPYRGYDATVLLDLTPSIDDIFAKIKGVKRNRIRKGLKNPVEFKGLERFKLSMGAEKHSFYGATTNFITFPQTMLNPLMNMGRSVSDKNPVIKMLKKRFN